MWFVYFTEQWNPKSPGMTAGSDWQRIMPSIGRRLTKQKRSGSQRSPVPPSLATSISCSPVNSHPYDPARAKQLLKEAGYPNGFDAGEIHAEPAILSLRRSNGNFLTAIGIKVKMRTMERAAYCLAREKVEQPHFGVSGAFGNAATRIEAFAVTGGSYAYGGYADIDALFAQQSVERDRQKRADLLYQIQRLMYDKVMYAPLFDPAFICASGPRVEVSGLGMIPQFAYSGPYEDLRLKNPRSSHSVVAKRPGNTLDLLGNSLS